MTLRILASAGPGELRVALLRDDSLIEYWPDRADLPDGVGDLHRARVTARAPAMAGAFLLLGGGETGFLPDDEAGPRRGAAPVQEGQVLAV
ncbi:MAG: ribonuclease, partial [Acetobacteraceae bacterium]|nr:ribonuclease [Acetobacteraceae bacterium]